MTILDYLGKPTEDGVTFREGDTYSDINGFVQLSRDTYNDDLHSCVVDELRLAGPDGFEVQEEVLRDLKKGKIPSVEEYELRSREFEDKLGSGFLIAEKNGLPVASCAICNKTDGYRYSAGIDENGDPVIDIWYADWTNQSHLWASPVVNESDNMNLSIANSLIGMRLFEQDGTDRVSFYNSIYTPELGTMSLMGRVGKATNGQEYAAKFPMVGAEDKGKEAPGEGRIYTLPNNGRLYMIDLTNPKAQAKLQKIETEIISALWGE